MVYDETLGDRIRKLVSRRRGIAEKQMFGGLCFLVNGNMFCGVVNRELCLRLGEEGVSEVLVRKHTRPMNFTGKVLKTMVYVAPAGFRTDAALKAWVDKALAFARTLPSKAGKD